MKHLQQVFFSAESDHRIMVEYACEGPSNCNKDQRSFKAYLARWLAVTTQIAPFTAAQIMPLIRASTDGAMKACVKAADGIHCGRKWDIMADDGERDIGNQLAAMSIVQANLVMKSPALADIVTGISTSNPNAGEESSKSGNNRETARLITTGDKAGAWTLTASVVIGSIGSVFLLLAECK